MKFLAAEFVAKIACMQTPFANFPTSHFPLHFGIEPDPPSQYYQYFSCLKNTFDNLRS